MGRSQESFNKRDIRSKKEKKRKEKEKKRLAKKEGEKQNLNDMIAYVDEFGNITDTPPDPDQKEEVDPEEIETSIPKTSPEDKEDQVREGVVNFFNESKGFGFIRDSNNRQDIFFHVNNVNGDAKEGNKVSYEVGSGPKGPIAVNVNIVK